MRLGLLLPVVVTGACWAQPEATVVREGPYWVRTLTGSIGVSQRVQVRITSRGAVAVRGNDGGDLRYTLRARVKAASESEARRLLDAYTVQARPGAGTVQLVVLGGGRGVFALAPELTVQAPKAVTNLVVETGAGDIRVEDIDGELNAVTGGGHFWIDRIGGTVSARTGGGEIHVGLVAGALRCLSGGGRIRVERVDGESVIETAGGEILVREARGPLRASTAGGSIHVERAARSVTAATAGGMIEVKDAGGTVTARSSGGPIQVGRAAGVRCETAAGTVRLDGVSGGLHVATMAGSILADLLPGGRLEDSSLSATSGDVVVTIPSDLAVTVRARTEPGGNAGKIVSDFAEIRWQAPGAPGYGAAVAEGALNGGGPVLRISVQGGAIHLRKK
ncbi:MAG: DUF4097 family beta strand repeat-containing protein [Bryobacteraceae bacterium]